MEILKPLITLIIWTIFMLVWLYAKRLPAMAKAKIKPDDFKTSEARKSHPLPDDAIAVSDNFTHLHEMPTLFYALCLAAAVVGINDDKLLFHAWVYVALRIAHSVIQALQGRVVIRFALFILSAIILAIMAIQIALKLF